MEKEKDEFSKRMKNYEYVTRNYLTLGVPKVIRLDMRAGHTFCRKFKKPFDDVFGMSMIATAKELCKQIPGVRMAYTQSDEISLILNDRVGYSKEYNCFFDGNVSKIVSVSASICTLEFNKAYANIVSAMDDESKKIYEQKLWSAQFDSRVWCLPNISELHNYVLWRQNDATRNSIQMVGHANFSDSELYKKNLSEIQDMLMEKCKINWNDFPVRHKRGVGILKEQYLKDTILPNGKVLNGVKRKRWIEFDVPILTKDSEFIEKVYDGFTLYDGKLMFLA